MATRHYESSDDDGDEFHSLSGPGDDDAGRSDGDDDTSGCDMAPPVHPIPYFQDAFEESIVDSTTFDLDTACDSDNNDAHTRRQRLLRAERYKDVRKSRYKQRPDARHHPFLKLSSQIVFGMHLLQQQQAKSNEEVVKILQNHVNEVDVLLERTSEDLDLACKDIQERIRYLKLPMAHMDLFEGMLNDKKFRIDLLAGNGKIERIIRRTAQALNDSMLDVQVGIKSFRELRVYLKRIESIWPVHDVEVGDVFSAMRGNEEGWARFLKQLQGKGADLGSELERLTTVIADIAKLAGEAGRRNKPTPAPLQIPCSSPRMLSKFAQESCRKPEPWLDKPLPKAPGVSNNEPVAKTHPAPFSTKCEQSREQASTPQCHSSFNPSNDCSRHRISRVLDNAAGVEDFRAVPNENVKELTKLTNLSDPLRSHPLTPMRTPVQHSRGIWSQNAAAVLNDRARKASPVPKRSSNQVDLSTQKHHRSKSMAHRPIGSGTKESKTPKRGETIIRYVPREPGKKEPPSISTGFTRRLSTKMKYLSPPVKYSPVQEPVVYAVDSAYSSGADKEMRRGTSSPTETIDDSGNGDFSKLENCSVTPAPEDKITPREGSRMGLFPKTIGPLTPLEMSNQNKDYFAPDSKVWRSSPNESRQQNRPIHQSKASRTLSLRRFFHRKGDSRTAAAS